MKSILLEIFLKGFIVGALTAFPFGPTAIMCIKKSLIKGNKNGYYVGIGDSIADIFFAIIAGFGITAVFSFLESNAHVIGFLGGVALIGLGLKEYTTVVHFDRVKPNGFSTPFKEIMKGFTIAIANPFVIFSFFALYAMFGLRIIAGNYYYSALLVVSTFLGSLVGFGFLNWVVIRKRKGVNTKTLRYTNKIIGILLAIAGIFIIVKTYYF